ncbi:MAG TPA: PH domain-containing protein [Micavibrio sp.]|nr:PH domain-containing protein [Micavibrio sp.]
MKQSIGGPSDQERLANLAGITMTVDENFLRLARIHGAIYWKGVAVAIIGMLLLPTFAAALGGFLIFVGVLMLVIAHMTRQLLLLAATDKRIIIRSGILYADMIELRYSQIESIELGINPIGQIFGYGSVIVTGTGQRRVIVPFIDDAISFRKTVNDVLVDK